MSQRFARLRSGYFSVEFLVISDDDNDELCLALQFYSFPLILVGGSLSRSNNNQTKPNTTPSAAPTVMDSTDAANDGVQVDMNGDSDQPSDYPPKHDEDTPRVVGAAAVPRAPSTDPLSKRNINSYYGHKIGFLQTLSLVLNAGLMVYAHVGLSAVIFSSRDPSITSSGAKSNSNNNDINTPTNDTHAEGLCNEQDVEIWIASGGETSRPVHSNFCSRTYNNGGCLVDSACIETCFQETYGYSINCSSCFGTIPACSINNECTWICAADSLGAACQECNTPCIEEFILCSGLPQVDNTTTTLPSTNETDTPTTIPPANAVIANACNSFDLEAIETWYNVYNLTFVRSVQDAWTGDAKLLAVIVVLFSGMWPYAKNIILVIVWYIPLTIEAQTSTLLWLSRLSKYTLVDVFAVISVLVGVQLQLNIGGTEAVIRAEPRFGIIAFLLATVWEFVQIEIIKAMHEKKVLGGNNPQAAEMLLFSNILMPLLILVTSLGLYIAGAILEIAYFTSADTNGSCNKSYNLISLGNALINDLSMTGNGAAGQTWILYSTYIVLNLAFPIITHIMQILFILGWINGKHYKTMFQWATAIWCFACVEVLLLGIFAVEFKVSILQCDSSAFQLVVLCLNYHALGSSRSFPV